MDRQGRGHFQRTTLASAIKATSHPQARFIALTLIDCLNDFVAGANSRPYWKHFAWEGIRERYRRTSTGLIWITLSTAIFVLSVGVLFGMVLGIRQAIFVPYLACSYITWILISGLVLDSCKVFRQKKGFILGSTLPLSVYVYEMVLQNFIKFAFALPVAVIVVAAFKVPVSLSLALVIPGLFLIALNGLWVAVILGLLCLRFHDLSEIVVSLMRIIFFLTPILWRPDMLAERARLAELNPFTHFMALVRDPSLGTAPSLANYLVCLTITVVGICVAIWVYGRWRKTIPFML